MKLGFTNNILTNSGDDQEDFWVFEIGPAVESSDLALRPLDQFTESQLQTLGIPDINADGYYEIGNISGSSSGLDIDLILPGYSAGALKFDAIEITDVIDGNCDGGTPGADIDAVCALSTLTIDCAGTTNGTAVIDDCGECLEPSDPNFNLSCFDCAGTLNGTAVIDDCELCLEPSDPNFNLSCAEEPGIYIPNSFSPNGDGINDRFQIFRGEGMDAQIKSYLIFNRWGGLIYELNDLEFNYFVNWWDGNYKGQRMQSGIYVYYIEIEFQNKTIRKYEGDINLIK